MPRWLTVTAHRPQDDLAARYRHARNPVERSPWHIVWLVAGGHHCPAVARLTGDSEDWGRTISHRSTADGPAAMADRRQQGAGHPPLLTPAVRGALGQALGEPPPDGGLWTGPKVAAWMAARSGRRAAGRRCGRWASRPNAPGPASRRPIRLPRRPSKKGAPGPDRRGTGRPSHRPAHGLGRGCASPRC